MKEAPGNVAGMGLNILGGTAQVTDKVVGNTLGRVIKKVQNKLLGVVPETATSGSFQATAGNDLGAKSSKKHSLFKRLFRRKKIAAEAAAEAEAELVEQALRQADAAARAESELQSRVGSVMGEGGLKLAETREFLEECLAMDECELDDDGVIVERTAKPAAKLDATFN